MAVLVQTVQRTELQRLYDRIRRRIMAQLAAGVELQTTGRAGRAQKEWVKVRPRLATPRGFLL